MDFTLVNKTIFPGTNFTMLDISDQCFHVVVVRATYSITAGGILTEVDKQPPIVMEDEFFGEPHKGSVKQESDLASFKPRCDVIVNCTAHSPDGFPAKKILAGITIYDAEGKLLQRKHLAVNCKRYWERSLLGKWRIKELQPLRSLPIRYEYAYGGELRIESNDPLAAGIPEKLRLTPEQRAEHPDGMENAPVYDHFYAANPLGCGHADPELINALNVRIFRVPLIEGLNAPIGIFMEPYPVQGLGIIGRTWQPRISLAGTYDEVWRAERYPYLPKDFDFGYFNCAHPDLQIPYPNGDEEIILYNLCAPGEPGTIKDGNGNTVMKFKLPAQHISLVLQCEAGKTDEVSMNIDTLIIDSDEKLVTIVCRRLLPVGEGIRAAIVDVHQCYTKSYCKRARTPA